MVDKKIIKKLEEENIRFVSEITYNKKIYVKAMKILKKRNRIYILWNRRWGYKRSYKTRISQIF